MKAFVFVLFCLSFANHSFANLECKDVINEAERQSFMETAAATVMSINSVRRDSPELVRAANLLLKAPFVAKHYTILKDKAAYPTESMLSLLIQLHKYSSSFAMESLGSSEFQRKLKEAFLKIDRAHTVGLFEESEWSNPGPKERLTPETIGRNMRNATEEEARAGGYLETWRSLNGIANSGIPSLKASEPQIEDSAVGTTSNSNSPAFNTLAKNNNNVNNPVSAPPASPGSHVSSQASLVLPYVRGRIVRTYKGSIFSRFIASDIPFLDSTLVSLLSGLYTQGIQYQYNNNALRHPNEVLIAIVNGELKFSSVDDFVDAVLEIANLYRGGIYSLDGKDLDAMALAASFEAIGNSLAALVYKSSIGSTVHGQIWPSRVEISAFVSETIHRMSTMYTGPNNNQQNAVSPFSRADLLRPSSYSPLAQAAQAMVSLSQNGQWP